MNQATRQRINPFNELYVTETISPAQFVSLFSPVLVEHASSLFFPGNVVVRGIQGSGKSMLLSLLQTEIRLAYKANGKELPVPIELRRFIGAGINISMSGALNFGQRAIEENAENDVERLPIYFGDFFNYYVVADLVRSIQRLSNACDGTIAQDLDLSTDKERLNACVQAIASDPCWFEALNGISSLDDLRRAAEQRVTTYRKFLQYNIEELPRSIKNSKTSIGEPISRLISHLRQHKVVPDDVQFFVQIDQYEELARLKGWKLENGQEFSPGLQYRRLINKALGSRDARVHYRIGSRLHAWNEDLYVHGTESQLEKERNYKIIDLDNLLRRRENGPWIFPSFAQDVFERRVRNAGFAKPPEREDQLSKFLGKGLTPEATARRYATTSTDRVLSTDNALPDPLYSLLSELARSNPLEAKLGEAWFLQKGPPDINPPTFQQPYPWNQPHSSWRKERVRHALMQIAKQNSQRMIWSGKDDVLSLSGGNILVFVSLCQNIWSAWLRRVPETEDIEPTDIPEVEAQSQAVGIQMASTLWYNKIPELSGKSAQRQRFVEVLGANFRDRLLNDSNMSFPGHNGFSVKVDELDHIPLIKTFIREAVDFGDLFEVQHTTKEKNRAPRTKWYLNPILSPHFQIPDTHVKEPVYVNIAEVESWLVKAGLFKASISKPPKPSRNRGAMGQLQLSDLENDGDDSVE